MKIVEESLKKISLIFAFRKQTHLGLTFRVKEMNLSLSTSNESGSITSVDTNIAILQTVVCMVVLPIGTILIYGIVLYEHEGTVFENYSKCRI